MKGEIQQFGRAQADVAVDLSILIVVYKGRQYVDACLRSIRENVTCSYEVILVDNGSPDETGDYVAEHYPWVRLVRSPENLGFTGGNNLAARYARGKGQRSQGPRRHPHT